MLFSQTQQWPLCTEGSQWPSTEHSWPSMSPPLCWEVWHTQCHLSPKRSVGHTVYGASTLWLSRAVCWRVGCLNPEELSNKCSVHRAGKSFNNFSVFISQIKYSQCEVLTAKIVFFCLGQVRFPLLNCSLNFIFFTNCGENKNYTAQN